MHKQKSKFVCSQCGYESAQWLGRCPMCEQFNTFVEELIVRQDRRSERERAKAAGGGAQPIVSTDLKGFSMHRLVSGLSEWDRVLGGGIVPGSGLIVGGEPGVGKSTLLTQVTAHLAERGFKCLFVTGEESAEQVALRLERLGAILPGLWVLEERDCVAIGQCIGEMRPEVAVVDSIQSTYHPLLTSSAGSVGQVRESAGHLIRVSKDQGTALLLVGHVTKEGFLAGPKVLEHIVDGVLYLEGEETAPLRLLRATKNRFGPTGEVGLFQMTEQGLKDVLEPVDWLIGARGSLRRGSAVALILEGRRPLLVEVQALVASNYSGVVRRVATGVDLGRVLMLIAVLERHLHCSLRGRDVYVNVAGGLRIREPACDLPVAMAILSSLSDRPLPDHTVFFGEIGLAGEVRPVSQPALRVKEAKRLGFDRCIGPEGGERERGWIGVPSLEKAAQMFRLLDAGRHLKKRGN